MPFKSFWYPRLFESKYITKNGKNIFLFFDSNPLVYNPVFLSWIREKVPNSRLCLLFVNSFCNRRFVDMGYFRKYFSLIMTTDVNDAKEQDIHYVHQLLSKMPTDVKEPTSTVCFVGANKGREELLLECYHRLRKLVGKENLDFTIVGMKGTENGISTDPLKYNDVGTKEISSKCLLEIVTGKQTGMTLRSAAAIVYDKFLITNNKFILSSPWYNENVLYIEKAEDITEEFINRVMTTEARYNYQNEFSPINIINHIEKFYC